MRASTCKQALEPGGHCDERRHSHHAGTRSRRANRSDRAAAAGAGRGPTSEQPDEAAIGHARLLRSSSDRVIAGVAGGLGDYFGVDPIIFRIGFVLSILFGGLGALAYVLLAVFVPTDGDPDAAQRLGRRLHRMGFWRAARARLIGCSLIGGYSRLAGGAAFAVASAGAFRSAIGTS